MLFLSLRSSLLRGLGSRFPQWNGGSGWRSQTKGGGAPAQGGSKTLPEPRNPFWDFSKAGQAGRIKMTKRLFEKPFLSLRSSLLRGSGSRFPRRGGSKNIVDWPSQPFLRFFPRRADKSGQNDKKGCTNPRKWFSVLSSWTYNNILAREGSQNRKQINRSQAYPENPVAGLSRKIRRVPFPPAPSPSFPYNFLLTL